MPPTMPIPPVTDKPLMPQGLATSFIYRLRKSKNPLFSSSTTSRGSKRTSTRVNYAEDNFEIEVLENDDDEEYDEGGHGLAIGQLQRLNSQNNHSSNASVNATHYQGKEAPKDDSKSQGKKNSGAFTNFTAFEIANNSALPENLVPITIKLESNGFVIKDMFLWNINEQLITPEFFASQMCQDLELPKGIESQIVNQIREQIQSFSELLSTPIPQLAQEKEFHVILELSVSIADQFYSDKVEWNLLGNSISPEEFAKTVVEDMGLHREFETAIAFSVHDEIAKVKRDLIENPQQVMQYTESLPYFNMCHQPPPATGSTTVNAAPMMELQGLRFDAKKHGDDFRPHLETLSEWEIEKRETEKERNQRRRKRETMRVGGPAGGYERPEREKKKRYDELEGTWRVY